MSWSLWSRFIWDDTSTHPQLNTLVLIYVPDANYIGIRGLREGDPEDFDDQVFYWADENNDYDDSEYLEPGSDKHRIHWASIPERP